LDNLHEYLEQEGIVVIKFNANKKTGKFYPSSARSAIQRMPQYRAQFRRDSVRLTAR
jgi:hypothetical protein